MTKNIVAIDCGDYRTQRFNVESLMKEHLGAFTHLFMTTNDLPRAAEVREWERVNPTLKVFRPGSREDGFIEFVGDLCIFFMKTPGAGDDDTTYVVTEVNESSDKTPVVFTGNCIITGGCGNFVNLQKGWESLKRIRSLPSESLIFPGFEAAAQMMIFAKLIDPGNEFVKKKMEEVKENERNIGQMMGMERLYNPFLRADQKFFKDLFGTQDSFECFCKMKKMMDKLVSV
jgi:glyoxylase-like metal-dependent hydrolase (beta-lactamase superfamily II)